MNYQLIKNNDWKEVEINDEKEKIPFCWNIDKISNLVKTGVTKGTTPSTIGFDFLDNGIIKFFKIEHLKNDTLLDSNVFISEECNKKMKRSQLMEDDLLFSIAGTIGNIAKVEKKHLPANTNQAVAIVRLKNKYDINFIKFYFKNYIKKLTKNALTGVISNFNLGMLENLEIRIPSMQEKLIISSILSKQESIISNIENLIEKNEIIFNELSEKLLSGELRLKVCDRKILFYKNPKDNWKEVEINGKMKNIPNDWSVKKIKAISKVCTGNTPSTKEESFWTNQDGFKWISTPDFRIKENGYINSFTRLLTNEGKKRARVCPKDTLLVSCIATIGEVGLLSEDSSFNQQINAILPNEMVSTRYLQYFFTINKQDFINYAPKSVVKIVNKELFENYEVYFCSNYEQKLIENMLFDLENKIVNLKKLLANEKEKFEWLLDNLLSGNYLVKEIEK